MPMLPARPVIRRLDTAAFAPNAHKFRLVACLLSAVSSSTPVRLDSGPMSTQIVNIVNQPLSAITPELAIGTHFAQVAGNGSFTDCTSAFLLTPGAFCNLSIDFTPQQSRPGHDHLSHATERKLYSGCYLCRAR